MENIYYQKALEYISKVNLNELETGKHVIDGDNLWVNICDSVLKSEEEARLEVHNRYMDLQIPLSGEEKFGVKPRRDCKSPIGEFNEEKDILFFEDDFDEIVTVKPGEQILFKPEDAHAPLIGEKGQTIHKAIFKIKA